MTDCQLVILVGGNVLRLTLNHVTNFRAVQTDGSSWSGSFHVERGGNGVEDLMGLLDASFFSQTIQPVGMWQYVIEPNPPYTGGELATYRYDDARLSLAPGGVAFTASGRVRV